MKYVLLALSLLILSFPTKATDEKSVQDLMLVSKMTGICGVMQQMATFQSSTQMPGGTEFIARFWRTEFARLGKSQAQFFKECEESVAIYTQLWEASEPTKK